jgi:hypothetical protein
MNLKCSGRKQPWGNLGTCPEHFMGRLSLCEVGGELARNLNVLYPEVNGGVSECYFYETG